MSPCDGKASHASRGAALIAMKKTSARGLEPYRCKFCRSWHLGHGKRVGR